MLMSTDIIFVWLLLLLLLLSLLKLFLLLLCVYVIKVPVSMLLLAVAVHRVPDKRSHFSFRHNFAICRDNFTIFEAPCSGLISAWYSLLHTHHQCEAFTRHNTQRQSCCCVQCALTLYFIPSDLRPLNSPDLNPVDYSF